VPGDGVSLHARDWGGAGRRLVLLHGLPPTPASGTGSRPVLAGAGLRVVARRPCAATAIPTSLADGYDFDGVGRDLEAALAPSG
jgi:pimeloyl-ACP methyl ester carboxylesterase